MQSLNVYFYGSVVHSLKNNHHIKIIATFTVLHIGKCLRDPQDYYRKIKGHHEVPTIRGG